MTVITAVGKGSRSAAATATPHSSAGISPTHRCTASLARSTCHGVTGRLCDSQIVLPSSETEGAVIATVDSTMHTAAAAMGAKRGMPIPTASDSTDRFS